MPRVVPFGSLIESPRRLGLAGRFVAVALFLCFPASPLFADQIKINFEGFADGTAITTQYPGLTFSNATVATAGISLNEFEFPPHSGANVVFDNGGPITVIFTTPVSSFGAFFTYSMPLTLDAFNTASVLTVSTTSLFGNNEELSGVPGSSPNEFLQVAFSKGISSVTILGASTGGSFTMDDATYITAIPEPNTLIPVLAGGAMLAGFRKRRLKAA